MNRVVVTVLILGLGVTVGGASAQAPAQYNLSVSPGIDIPTYNITYGGNSYSVSAIGTSKPGDTITADISTSAGEDYDVSLYNSQQQILDRSAGSGDRMYEFEMAYANGKTYSPGTYAIVVSQGGEYRAVPPLVVAGYGVSVTTPDTTEEGSQLPIQASVTTIDDEKPIDAVQVVIVNETTYEQFALTRTNNENFTGPLNLETLSTGEHSLYVVVQGNKEFLSSKEILGVSNTHSLSIGTDSSSEPATTDYPQTDSSTRGTTTKTTTQPLPTADDSTSPESVISPNHQMTTENPTMLTTGQPLGVLPLIAALILIAFLSRRYF